jgi:hypothetical protein
VWYNGFAENTLSPGKEEVPLKTIITVSCPKRNNSTKLIRYGKTLDGYQKYQRQKRFRQFSPAKPAERVFKRYPPCPKCGKTTFLHHDRAHYFNYRCRDRKRRHSFFVPKTTVIAPASASKLLGKTDFKRMRFPVRVVLNALAMFYIGTTSFRKIALILRLIRHIDVSHQTISDWR